MKDSIKDVTNMIQCKWLLSGADPDKKQTACDCQLALRNAKRKNDAIDEIEADRAAKQKRGEAIYNEFIERLTRYQDDYIREMNRLRKVPETGSVCWTTILGQGGCSGLLGADCTKDCFTKNNPKRCWSGKIQECDSGEMATCLLTYQEIINMMKASDTTIWETAHTLLPADGSLGTIERMTTPFLHKEVKDRGPPSAGPSCDNNYTKPIKNASGDIIPKYTPPPSSLEKDPVNIACCNNIVNILGPTGAFVINQSSTGCGASSEVKEKAKKVEVEQSVSSIDDPSGNPLVNFAYKQPILASVSAGSVSLIVFTIIFSIFFRSVWIGLGVGSLFGITTGVAGFIILKRVIDDKNAKLLADLEKVKQARAQSKAEYEQKIAEIEAEPPSKGSCDEECGENSVKEKLGGNLTVGAGDDKRCICECKKDFSPGGLERPACQPESFVCTEAAKEALKLPNAGVVTCRIGTRLKSAPPNIFFDSERAARNVCCEGLEVEPSVTF
jgi:hypothetical protein